MKKSPRLYYFCSSVGLLSVIVVLIFSNTLNSVSELKTQFRKFTTSFWSFDKVLFSPNSGYKILPTAVLEIKSILDKAALIEEFNLSESLQNDPFIYQRIVEGVWPKKFVASSPFLFIDLDELPEHKEKRLIAEGREIALVLTN